MTSITDVAPTRRTFLSRAAVVGAAGGATVTGLVGPAHAADREAERRRRYKPAHYQGKRLLSGKDRHLVTRFSYGVTPELAAQVRQQGGARRWFEKQLDAERIADDQADRMRAWWPSFERSASDLWNRTITEVEGGWEVMEDYERWVLVRRMHSKRQVLEMMTEFWENHFNVPANGDPAFTWRVGYGDAIRANALGRFEDLLQGAVTHPAMLIYLDGAVSTAEHPNENLGRELLELHTLGQGNYDETDVQNSSRILTGFSVDMWRSFSASYRGSDHWTGPVRVQGFSHANSSPDGREVVRAYLSYLAHHPATAQRIARKLATKFVGDNAPQSLVDDLARVYRTSGTAIKPVLRALVGSAAFKRAAGSKVRDPGEDIVATYRALGVSVKRPRSEDSAVNALLWQTGNIGTTPFAWPRPDGQPIDNDSWSSPSRLVASMEMHYAMSGGWWPSKGIHYRKPTSWMPARKMRFDKLVDHLSQQLLHRRSDARLLEACCHAVGVAPHEMITPAHGLVKWNFARLLTTFLDSPAHLTR